MVEVGQMSFLLLLLELLVMVMMVVVRRHLGSVRGRVKEASATAAFAIRGVLLVLLRQRRRHRGVVA